jgi:transposase
VDNGIATKWPQPASPQERRQWIEVANAVGIDGEMILRVNAGGGQRDAEAPMAWHPLSDQEYAAISPYLPAGVRGAKGPGPRAFVDLLLSRVAHRHTGWRGAPGIETAIQADLARQRFHRWTVGHVLDDLIAAIPRLHLDPARKQQLYALGRMVREAQARLAENGAPPRRQE